MHFVLSTCLVGAILFQMPMMVSKVSSGFLYFPLLIIVSLKMRTSSSPEGCWLNFRAVASVFEIRSLWFNIPACILFTLAIKLFIDSFKEETVVWSEFILRDDSSFSEVYLF